MKKNVVLEIYLALVAAVSLIIFTVGLSMILSKTMGYFLVSWEEYKLANKWYLDTPCDKTTSPTLTGKTTTNVVDEECKKQNENELKLKRQLEIKQTFINSLPVSVIFLIIFWIHYRALKAYMGFNKDIEVEK